VSAGRYLAFLGALISPLLLITDLKTRSRWYNMLRIFRGTSPMNIGSWTLFAFGTASGLAALFQLFDDIVHVPAARTLARLSSVPAAVAGGLLATYTGSLLSATSTPLWAVVYRWLPAMFGASGTATATAALSLVLEGRGAHASLRRLERLALLTGIVEFLLSRRIDHEWARNDVRGPLEQPPLRMAHQGAALGLGIIAPLLVHALQLLTRREMRTASTAASVAVLAGGYALRAVVIMAGKRSAERPRDYFQTARAG
jgi:formate-dependent nitrite reductase membrane component NrfD